MLIAYLLLNIHFKPPFSPVSQGSEEGFQALYQGITLGKGAWGFHEIL